MRMQKNTTTGGFGDQRTEGMFDKRPAERGSNVDDLRVYRKNGFGKPPAVNHGCQKIRQGEFSRLIEGTLW